AAGWAHALHYYHETLKDDSYRHSIAVVLGGDGSVATNGFWAALNIAATRGLPLLFFIEDNGYGLSVASAVQKKGGNIATNLRSFARLPIYEADSAEPASAAAAIQSGVAKVRSGSGPVLVRLRMPRLSGHSGQDTQAYKSSELVEAERTRDPLMKLRNYLVPDFLSTSQWNQLEGEATEEVSRAYSEAAAS